MISMAIASVVEETLRQMAGETGVRPPEGMKIVVEHPANPQHGDYSVNTAMQLAKAWRKPPLAIAGELAEKLSRHAKVDVLFGKVEAVAPGFINFHLDWGKWAAFAAEGPYPAASGSEKVLIEHTSINPNKSAHIGHLRNSCIGDTLARMLKQAGCRVEVHNYIDDLGNQLADTLVGIAHTPAERPYARFGDFCWDTYAAINKAYKQNPELQNERTTVLHELERGVGRGSWLGLLAAERIVSEHLEEMKQFGIGYDVLVWESSIVREGFWQRAFELLRRTEAFRLETAGKLAGCWVLKLDDRADAETGMKAETQTDPAEGAEAIRDGEGQTDGETDRNGKGQTGAEAALAGEERAQTEAVPAGAGQADGDGGYEADKVLVRSNGVLTYTAKDIAYHLWKFGLLGKEFRYKPFAGRLWSTHADGVKKSGIGRADTVINVIDHRQEYPQTAVKEALRALGFAEQADRLKHAGYGVVSLSPATAAGLGIDISDGRASYPMSGRQGIGIKIADLLDRMESVIDGKRSRKAGLSSRAIAAASIRYYLLRFHLQTEIVFDLEQATEISGNTGVYLLYAHARACGILDKAGYADAGFAPPRRAEWTAQERGLMRALAYGPETKHKAAAELAPNVLCAYAHELTTLFNHFYAACPILKAEGDVRHARLWLTARFRETLREALDALGLPAPRKM